MEGNNLNRDLVCVLFPGIVKNEEKAIQCLGGIKRVSEVYSQCTKMRLGLSFAPDNPFIKKLYADPHAASGMLLKVKLKKTRVGKEVKREVISTSVVGTVKKIYTFESMADYQYLPIHKEGAGPHKCLIDRIMPSGLDPLTFLYEPAPLYLPPSHFTRFEKKVYSYTSQRYGAGSSLGSQQDQKSSDSDTDDDMHQISRYTRSLPRARLDFNLTDEFPTEPHEYYTDQKNEKLKLKIYTEKDFETIKKLFDERPIWSVNLIRYHTKYSYGPLRVILPCVAYNMRTGPWRGLWIKLGYDPRKEPSARFYQILDFRMRIAAGVKSMVKCSDRRNYRRADRLRVHSRARRNDRITEDNEGEITDNMCYFKLGLVPRQRQVFFMYCDVQLPEVQELVGKEPAPGALCHHKRGWLAPGVAEACRDLLTKHVQQTLLANQNEEHKLELGKSDEELNSEDDDNSGSNPTKELDEPSTSSAANPTPSTSSAVNPTPSTSSAVNPTPSTSSAVNPTPSTSSAVNPTPSTSSAVNPTPSTSLT